MADSIGERFMSESRYENMGETAQSRKLPQPPLELPWDENIELTEGSGWRINSRKDSAFRPGSG